MEKKSLGLTSLFIICDLQGGMRSSDVDNATNAARSRLTRRGGAAHVFGDPSDKPSFLTNLQYQGRRLFSKIGCPKALENNLMTVPVYVSVAVGSSTINPRNGPFVIKKQLRMSSSETRLRVRTPQACERW